MNEKKTGTTIDSENTADFTQVTLMQLVRLTGKESRTIHKRIDGIPPVRTDKKSKWYLAKEVLPIIYDVQLGGVKLDINQENAKLSQIKQRKELLKLDEQERRLIPIELIERQQNQMLTAFRSKILSIPTKLAPRLASMTNPRSIEDELIRECREALTELSNYEPNQEEMGITDEDDEEVSEVSGTTSRADD
jgi:hypothetical protein